MLARARFSLTPNREVASKLTTEFPRLSTVLRVHARDSTRAFTLNDYLFVRGFLARRVDANALGELDNVLSGVVMLGTNEDVWIVVREALVVLSVLGVFRNIVSLLDTNAHEFIMTIYPFLVERVSCAIDETERCGDEYRLRRLSLGPNLDAVRRFEPTQTARWLLARLGDKDQLNVARRVDVSWCADNGSSAEFLTFLMECGARPMPASLTIPRMVSLARCGLDHRAFVATRGALRTALLALGVRLCHTPLFGLVVQRAKRHLLLQPQTNGRPVQP